MSGSGIKKILITQQKPDTEKTPYHDLAERHSLNVTFRAFVDIVGITPQEFRKSRINILSYKSIIFTSRNVVDHYFSLCNGLRINMPENMKYFCISEAIALYLQKYIQYRKRKIFFGKQDFSDLLEVILRQKEEPILYPCSDLHKQDIPQLLEKNSITYSKAVIYKSICCNLTDLASIKYDMMVFFSPSSVKALLENFPDFRQNHLQIAAFGPSTAKAVIDSGLRLDLQAPTPSAPSMTMAIEQFIRKKQKNKVA